MRLIHGYIQSASLIMGLNKFQTVAAYLQFYAYGKM